MHTLFCSNPEHSMLIKIIFKYLRARWKWLVVSSKSISQSWSFSFTFDFEVSDDIPWSTKMQLIRYDVLNCYFYSTFSNFSNLCFGNYALSTIYVYTYETKQSTRIYIQAKQRPCKPLYLFLIVSFYFQYSS